MISRRVRRELRKLRELVRIVLHGTVCCFCGEPLLDKRPFKAGEADGPKLREQIACHHLDGNHANDEPANLDLAHRRCHLAHHARMRARKNQSPL